MNDSCSCGCTKKIPVIIGGVKIMEMFDCDCRYNKWKTEKEQEEAFEAKYKREQAEHAEQKRISRIPTDDRNKLVSSNYKFEMIAPEITRIQGTGKWNINILMRGPSNSGKTFDLEWLLYKSAVNNFFVLRPDEIIDIMYGRNENIDKRDIFECEVLLIDDINKVTNKHEINGLFNCLDDRSSEGLSTWLTSRDGESIIRETIQEDTMNRFLRRAHITVIKKAVIEEKLL